MRRFGAIINANASGPWKWATASSSLPSATHKLQVHTFCLLRLLDGLLWQPSLGAGAGVQRRNGERSCRGHRARARINCGRAGAARAHPRQLSPTALQALQQLL